MATTPKKSILLDIKLNVDELVNNITKAREALDKLKQANIELKEKSDAALQGGNTASFQKLQEQIVLNEVAIRGFAKEIKNSQNLLDLNTQANKANKGSYEQLLRVQQIAQINLKNLEGTLKKNKDGTFELTQEYVQAKEKVLQAKDAIIQFDQGIKDGRTNVGNYTSSLIDAIDQTGLFGGKLTALKQGFAQVQQGVTILKAGFGSLRTAIASTGIGALILAITALVVYFSKFQPAVEAVQRTLAGVGAVMDVVKNALINLGQVIVNAFTNPKKIINEFLDLIKNTVGKAFSGLGKIIQGALSFDFTKIKEGVDSIGTGFKNAGDAAVNARDKIRGALDDIATTAAKAAKAAADLKEQEQQLNDNEEDFQITREKTKAQIDELIVKSKNRTLSDQERVEFLKQAGDLEQQLTQKELTFAQQRLDITIKQNANSADFTDTQKKRFFELSNLQRTLTEAELKEFRDLSVNKGKIATDDFNKQREQNIALIQITASSVQKQGEIIKTQSTLEESLKNERIQKEKEFAENRKKIEQQLQDEIIIAITNQQQKLIETERTNTERRLAEIKGNSEKEVQLREQIEINSTARINAIKENFTAEQFQKELERTKQSIENRILIEREGSQALFQAQQQLEDVNEQKEINDVQEKLRKKTIDAEESAKQIEIIEEKYRNKKKVAEAENEKAIIATALQAKKDQLDGEIIQLELTQQETLAKQLEAEKVARDILLQEKGITAEKKFLIEQEYNKKVNHLINESLQNELQAIQMKAQVATSFLSALNSISILFMNNQSALSDFERAVALFQIAVSTAVAIANAVKSGASLPYPGNVAAIASGVAIVLANVVQAKRLIDQTNNPEPANIEEFMEGGATKNTGLPYDKHADYSQPYYKVSKVTSDDGGGMVSNPTLFVTKSGQLKYIAGEEQKKTEWIAPGWMVDHPIIGQTIANLEFLRQGKITQFADGGFTAQRIQQATVSGDISGIVQAILDAPPPIVTVEDINAGLEKRVRITTRGDV